jgi:TolA-binding protein
MNLTARRVLFFGFAAGLMMAGGRLWAQTAEQSQLDFANGLFGRGYYEDAATEYRAYLDDYPVGEREETALYRLGESLYAQKKFTEALEVFGQVRKRFPSSNYLTRSQLREGVSLYRLGKLELALSVLNDVVGREADAEIKGEALYYLGKLYTDTRDWPSAIQAYERLSKEATISSYAPFGEYQLAVVYVGQGKLEAAAVMFMSIGDDGGANAALQMDSLYRAGEAYDQLGWHDAAILSYQKLKERFPESDYARKADYGLSWSLYRAGDYDGAIGAIDAFMKRYPESRLKSGLEYLKGNCFLKQEDYAKAEALYQQVIDGYANTPYARQAQYKMAVSLMAHDADVEAKGLLESLTREGAENSMSGDAVFLLATLYMDSKEYGEAALQFLRVVEQYPKSEFQVDSLYKLGECYALSENLGKSAETFEEFARVHKDHPLALEAVFHSADAYFQRGDYQQALVRFEHVAGDATGSRFGEEALYRMAISYHNLSNFEAVADAFRGLLAAFPSSRHAAEAHYRIGDFLLYDKENAVDAVEHFKKVRGLPENAYLGRALKGVAVAHFSMKDFDGAVGVFYRVVMEHPDVSLRPDTYEWVGQHLYDREEWKQSADVFTALLERTLNYPRPERIYLKLGETYSAMKRIDAALEAYGWIQENAPKTPSAHESTFRIAALYEEQGRAGEAMTLYERAATAAMNDTAARARFRLGELYEGKKEYAVAAKNYMRVAILFLHPTLSPESMWRAGQCFEKGANPESAIKIYSDILREYPDSEQAESAKARLAELSA